MKTYARGFAAGEVTPEFWGRIDDAKYQMGLALCRNFEVLPHGPVRNRAGFAFVRQAKLSAKRSRLIPFTFSSTQTMVLEFGHGYIRFHTQGATLMAGAPPAWATATAYVVGSLVSEGGANYYSVRDHTSAGSFAADADKWYALPAGGEYEIPTPYTEDDLPTLHYVQSADVLTIVCPRLYARELRRLGGTHWVLSVIDFASPLSAPTGLSVTATVGPVSPGPATIQSYVVTAVGGDGNESPPSTAATDSNNLFDHGAFNTLAWSTVTGATRYRVYRLSGGVHGYVGETTGTSFVDQGGGDVVTPDVGRTPPMEGGFTSSIVGPLPPGAEDPSRCPGAVTYFEQRRWFAGTASEPQTLIGTRSGSESAMTYSLPIRDDDRVRIRVAAREANTIRHLVPLGALVLLTGSAEWVVTSVNTDAVTPTSIAVRPQSYVGANDVQPVVVHANAVYAAARGGHVIELSYHEEVRGLRPSDLSLRAPHLFDGEQIVDLAYAKAPYPIVWAVSSSGRLLGMTYIPEQNVTAWHRHDTHGVFESVCVVAEGDEDALYAVVRRVIDGGTVRYIERQRSRRVEAVEDSFFVDSGLSYEGPPETAFSGLGHLEGETVAVLADGAVMAQAVVSGGSVTIAKPASKVHIGLPITADLQTLPLVFEVQGFGQGRPKNVNEVSVRISESSGLFVGPRFDKLTEWKQRTDEPYGAPPRLRTAVASVKVAPSWGDDGAVCLRQANPLPLTVLSMTIDFATGG